jgi:hypothetical protein
VCPCDIVALEQDHLSNTNPNEQAISQKLILILISLTGSGDGMWHIDVLN